MKIEIADIKSIKPYENNPRKLSDKAIETVAMSLKEYGFRQPIVVDKDRIIVVGHTRFRASKKLGFKEVPITIADNLTTEQINAYRIADNRTSEESEWDNELLKMELKELDLKDFNLELTGFNEDQLNDLLFDEKQGLTDEDEIPETPEEPITKLGDIWKLGNHRVMCGDCTDINNVDKLLNNNKIDLLFTSPPYNAGKSEKLSGNTHLDDNKYNSYNDNKNQSEFLDFLISFTNAWLNKCKCLVVNIQQLAGNKIAFIEYLNTYKNNLIDIAIWNKGHSAPAMAENVMNSCFEYILFFSNNKNPTRSIPTSDFRGTVKNVYDGKPNRNNKFSKYHGATFSVDFPTWVIENFTKNNNNISDCFCGTGTTLIACEKLNRNGYFMELDPIYCDIIIKRWEDFTGKKAELENGQN